MGPFMVNIRSFETKPLVKFLHHILEIFDFLRATRRIRSFLAVSHTCSDVLADVRGLNALVFMVRGDLV